MKKLFPFLVVLVLLAIPTVIFLFRTPTSSPWEVLRVLKIQEDNIRALEVTGDDIYAASNHGYFIYSKDGGETWGFHFVDSIELRSIVVNEDFIYLASAGDPAVIYQSKRDEIEFSPVFHESGNGWFIDAMKSDGQQGFWVFGDNRFLVDSIFDVEEPKLLAIDTVEKIPTLIHFSYQAIDSLRGDIKNRYNDFEKVVNPKSKELTTQRIGDFLVKAFINLPIHLDNEHGYAAGNSCLQVRGDSIDIVTGGTYSQWIHSADAGKSWAVTVLPYSSGKSSGAFGISLSSNKGVIVGGDYAIDTLAERTTYYTRTGGENWFPSKGVNGYLSDVEYLGEGAFMATGTQGTCWTLNSGQTWEFIDGRPFNTIEINEAGDIWLAGETGIARVVVKIKSE